MSEELPDQAAPAEPTMRDTDRTILVTSMTNGNIVPMRLASEDQKDEKGRRIAYIHDTDEDGQFMVSNKGIAERNLTDEHQDLLAETLAATRPNFTDEAAERAKALMDTPEEAEALATREEAIEDLGEEAVEQLVEEPEETKELLFEQIESAKVDLRYHIDSFAGQRGYIENQAEQPTTLEALQKELRELNGRYENNAIAPIELALSLTRIVEQIDVNIVGSQSPFNSRDFRHLTHESKLLGEPSDDPEVRHVRTVVEEIIVATQTAANADSDLKMLVHRTTNELRDEIIPRLRRGIPIQDLLYGLVVNQMNAATSQDDVVRRATYIVKRHFDDVDTIIKQK